MNITQLEKGKEIRDKISALERVVEHFGRKSEGDPISTLTDFLLQCRNIDYPGGKPLLATHIIEFILSVSKASINDLDNEFKEI